MLVWTALRMATVAAVAALVLMIVVANGRQPTELTINEEPPNREYAAAH
jgi:hypothetical protein